ncbi:MAG TPA: hypothetical protein VM364_05870 [Vicinamibacterales bacterium]|nr:hypothetical protein [Vicinamibacterales bacterium]
MSRRQDLSAVKRALTESSAETWARWSEDRQRREIQRRINAEMEVRHAADLPIYPRECAARIAEETRTVAPDWRHIRPTLGPAWGRLLKAQPELAPDLTKQREATITAVFNAVPRHLQECVRDLRTLIDLLLTAHEAAAYQVGFEGGKLHAQDRGGQKRAQRKRGKEEQGDTGLRLTLARE